MTDQYKELRLAASHVPDVPWAKQALQLLDEMEAVGAGGVSGKGSVALEPGVLKPLDNTGVLKSWVSLINQADDETKAILRMGLKEEIERMFPDSERRSSQTWVKWKGGENPVPGKNVSLIFYGGDEIENTPSDKWEWHYFLRSPCIAFYKVEK